MSNSKLTESLGLNELQENQQGDTFIFSDQQIKSQENLDEFQQRGDESYDQGIEEGDMSFEQGDEYLCDDLDGFDADMQDIDGEEYLEEQALESYLYSLKKKTLTILYKNCQQKQQQKQLIHQILLRFEAKNDFLFWHQISMQKYSQQQQEDLLQNVQEVQIEDNNYFYEQGKDSRMQSIDNQADKCNNQLNNYQQQFSSNLLHTFTHKQEFKCAQQRKEESESFQIQIQNEDSLKQSTENQMQNNYEEIETENDDSYDNIKENSLSVQQIEDKNEHKQENKGLDRNESEISSKSMNEQNKFQIDEDQFMDQEQFEEQLNRSSNYNSINYATAKIRQNYQIGHQQSQNCQASNVIEEQKEQFADQNTGQDSTDKIQISFEQNYQIESTSSNSSQNQLQIKDDQKLKDLNHSHQALIVKGTATVKVQPEKAQSVCTLYQTLQNKQNELQVEQNIFDERSFDTHSTQKIDKSAVENKFYNDLDSNRSNTCQYQQEVIDSYRKESSTKLNSATINNKANHVIYIQNQRNNENQAVQAQEELNKINNNFSAQPVHQNSIIEKEEIQNFKNQDQSTLIQSKQKDQQKQIEVNLIYCDQSNIQSNHLNNLTYCQKQKDLDKVQSYDKRGSNFEKKQQLSSDSRYQKQQKDDDDDDDQYALDKENYLTHRNNDSERDKRLSQIEAFSISKNIELTPGQQQMILSSHRNNTKNNHGQSISQDLEEEQEQAVDDLAHEVAFYIFGKKLFKKLRFAYKTSRTLDRPQSSRCHLTQYSSNEQLRLQQEKIVTMRKCFDALKRLKNLNKKKKEIQQRLFNYYEIRYIRRPLKIWHQNNKIWLAQRVSFTIFTKAMQKVQVFQAFQRIKQFYLHKKREGTINNLLKYYERTSSPYLSKNTPLEIQNKKTSKETQLHANGFSKKIQECSSQSNQNNFLSTEYLDKENNSYLCNVNPMIESEAQECYGVSRKYSKTENQNGFISNTLKQEYKKELRQKQQISVSNSLSQTHTQDSKKNEKMLTEQSLRQKQSILTNNIQDKNQQYFNEFSSQLEGEQNQMIYTKKQGNIQNYQSIQISEYGINNSTEISDNELNCCNMKSSINELNAKAKHQMSQNNFDISGIINDKSSMVYNCTRNTLNSERNNYQKTLYSANSCFLPSKKNNNLNKQQANEESLMDHQEINFNNLESNQNSTFSEKSQFYLNNEIISGRQKDTINLFDPIKNYQKILSHNASVEQLESKQLSQRNNLNEPNLQRQTNQGTDIICNQKSKIQESQQLIFFHKQINYQESSLTPSKDIQKNLNNQIQCSSNQIKPSSAFTFTHSQIKNSLNVPTQQTHINQKEEHNLNQSENHNLNDQQSSYKINNPTNSFKQAGKIKKNSFNRSFQESEEQSEFNNELNGHAQDSGKKQNTFASRGKHNYSFSQNINYVQNQEKQIINDRVNNLNNDSNGLVSFVNRNRSCNRINQQLEQQAEAFNAKKLTLSRNSQQNLMSIENKINQDQTKNSKQDGRNLFQNSSLHQNSNEINQDKFLIHSVKPPLQNNQLKTDRSSHNRSIDIKQPISTKQQLNMQQLEQMAKIEENLQIKSQNFLKKDLNPQNPQDSKSIHNIQEINQIVNQKQKSEAAAPFRNFIKDEFASNPSNLSLHQLSQQEQQKEIMNSSTNQIQSFEQVNLSYLQQKDSILSNLPHNYQNHLKNQQFSQMIQETAKQIEKRKLPITQKKQEQINQLQQYQYFKQIQQQRIQQQQQSNKINSNNTSVNNSFSRNNQKQQNNKNNKINDSFNTSQERNKKRDLSNVGQSIQNILYFEAKIRSKRLARSQERSKNDSTELCKKLENLEQYIQQINHELIQEKEKKQLLIQENAYLINQSQQI